MVRPRRKSIARRRRRLALAGGCVLLALGLVVANWVYHVLRKPSEVLALVAPTAPKTYRATWDAYGPLFREHATDVVTAPLLAALAQVESRGDPLARTYWRWRWSWNPLEIYAPASSAVGMLQITDGAFVEARRYCIRGHAVATDGAWYDPRSCWFTGLYSRAVPSHAVELTSARLHTLVGETLQDRGIRLVSLAQKQQLAAVIHLCGRQRGAAFAQRGFRVASGERCGDHGLAHYLGRVESLTRAFTRLDAATENIAWSDPGERGNPGQPGQP